MTRENKVDINGNVENRDHEGFPTEATRDRDHAITKDSTMRIVVKCYLRTITNFQRRPKVITKRLTQTKFHRRSHTVRLMMQTV